MKPEWTAMKNGARRVLGTSCMVLSRACLGVVGEMVILSNTIVDGQWFLLEIIFQEEPIPP